MYSQNEIPITTKDGKKQIFFSKGAYAQHKRRTYNLKGPRAARTCLVTLKRVLLTIQLVGSGGHSLASHYGKKISFYLHSIKFGLLVSKL